MKLENVLPYLPAPIAGAVKVWKKDGPEHEQQEARHLVFTGALAVAGYVLASKYASRAGLDLTKVALFTLLPLGASTRLAVGGHVVYKGLTEAAAARAKREWASVAKGVALAAIGYFTNTKKFSELYMTHVFSWFKP